MESVLDFLRQGGYAFFVWSAFGVTFLLLIAETLQLRKSQRTILSRVGRLVRLRGSQDAASAAAPTHTASSPKTPAEPGGENR
jgi:heme exporter protein D